MKKTRKSIPPDVYEDVVAQYRAGATLQEIAAVYDVSLPTVAVYLRRHGGTIRTRREINQQRAPVDEAMLRTLIAERLTLRAIAAALQVSVPTIERHMRALGLRSQHGRGSPMERNYFWQGGRTIDTDGYVLVKSPGHPHATKAGYVREHRLVMEQQLGRFLAPEEIVHHKQPGAKGNNAPDNLELYHNNSVHFLHEHNAHPRDLQTGRFLRKPIDPLSVSPALGSAIPCASKNDVLQ